MSNVVFFSPQDLITKPEGRPIVHGIDSSVFMGGVAVEQPLIGHFPLLKKIFFPHHAKNADDFFNTTQRLLAGRIALEKEGHADDIFGSLLKTGGDVLSFPEMAIDALTMIIAGRWQTSCLRSEVRVPYIQI
jgi:hypothetical protein